MLLKIDHTTTYEYDTPVPYALQQVRLTPHDLPGQSVKSWATTISGGQKEVEYTDYLKNNVILVGLEENQTAITINCSGEIETSNTNGIYGEDCSTVPLWYYLHSTPLTEQGPNIINLAIELGNNYPDEITRLHALSSLIAEKVTYETGTTHPETTAEQALSAGNGVCQDHAHIFISTARQLGYPARYISGYLMMDDRIDQDASHAWAEAHVDNIGWIGFDVSNNISPDERYIRIANGLDYKEAAPISGMRMGESNETMVVTLQIQQ